MSEYFSGERGAFPMSYSVFSNMMSFLLFLFLFFFCGFFLSFVFPFFYTPSIFVLFPLPLSPYDIFVPYDVSHSVLSSSLEAMYILIDRNMFF